MQFPPRTWFNKVGVGLQFASGNHLPSPTRFRLFPTGDGGGQGLAGEVGMPLLSPLSPTLSFNNREPL